MYKRSTRKNAQPGYAAYKRFGGYAAKWAADRIGSWAKGRLAARAAQKDKARKRSKTSTKTLEGVVQNEGVGGQYTEFNYRGPSGEFVQKLCKELAPLVEIVNGAGQQLVGAGVQAAFQAFTMGDAATINTFQGASKTQRLVITKARGEVFFTNCFKSNLKVTVYDVIAKRDMPLASIQSAINAWTQGSADAGTSTAFSTVGGTPQETDTFNFFYKVAQRTELVLAGGACHRHRVELTMNKLLAAAEPTYLAGFKDVTYCCVIVISGQPSHDSTTKTAVTSGTGGLDFVWSTEHRYKVPATATMLVSRSNNLGTTFAVSEAAVLLGGTATGTNAEA